jgi:PAS domain S-box-containing protein
MPLTAYLNSSTIPTAVISNNLELIEYNAAFTALFGLELSNHVGGLLSVHDLNFNTEGIDTTLFWKEQLRDTSTFSQVYIPVPSEPIDDSYSLVCTPFQVENDVSFHQIQFIPNNCSTKLKSFVASVFKSFGLGVALVEPQKGIGKFNAEFSRIFELPQSSINDAALPLESLIPISGFRHLLQDLPNQYSGDSVIELSNGKKRFIHITKSILDYNSNTPLQLIQVIDNTEKEFSYNEIKKSEQFFLSISKNFPHGAVGILNRKLHFLFFDGTQFPNPEVPASEYIGESVFKAFSESSHERLKKAFELSFEGQNDEFELECNGKIFMVNTVPLKGTNGSYNQIMLVLRDISPILKAEREIEFQKNYLRQIIDTDPNLIFVKDPEGRFVLVNKAFADYYMATPDEIIGKRDENLGWSEEEVIHFSGTDKTVFKENRLVTLEEKVTNPKTKTTSYFLTTKKPIEFKKGEPLLLGVAVNITGRRIYEEKLKSSEALLQEVFEKAADALYLLDAESEVIVDCNQKAIALFGFDNKSDIRGPLSGLILSKQLKAEDILQQLRKMDVKNSWSVEAEILTPSGYTFWANMAATKFLLEGKEFYLLRISDISYQKQTEEQIKQSLHEKEILIQEIHHRVKNNMAVISSLLQLQSGYIKEPAMLEVLRDSQNRIKSMALIHEKLYQNSTLALIEFESYVKELAHTIMYSYSQQSAQILIEVHIKQINLDINAAVPCGLIINELLSNACKHAFVGRTVGRIDIYFEKNEDMFILTVKDDGVGLPSKDIVKSSKSLGMTLIQALTSQLNATMEIDINNGTCFKLTFKDKQKKSFPA